MRTIIWYWRSVLNI